MVRWHRYGWIGLSTLLSTPLAAQVTRRVSVDSAGVQGNATSWSPAFSADGRWVAFESGATNLVPGDTNGSSDVFVKDLQTGAIERVSVDSSSVQGNAGSAAPAISSDGRFVAFWTAATNLTPGDMGDVYDVLVRDRQNGTTERVSVDALGQQGNGDSMYPAISADGRFVAFESLADNLVSPSTGNAWRVFVHDRQTGTNEVVDVDSGGTLGNNDSQHAGISADGRFVSFHSFSSNLVAGDTNGVTDVFLRDRLLGTTSRVSVATGGGQATATSVLPSISADGTAVVFRSDAVDLVDGDTNGTTDVFLRDLVAGTTERVSVGPGGVEGNEASGALSTNAISANGRFVVFGSIASNLVPGDTNGPAYDLFVRDRVAGTTERVTVTSGGAQLLADSSQPAISGDGRYVAFFSLATNVVPNDTNGVRDVFVRDRLVGGETTSFTSVCEPGAGSVAPCPCGNAAGSPGRGCDNSAATGGAALAASGDTELSADGLVFTTSGEMPSALSVLAQGSAFVTNGAVYGQGVRCVGGALKRLFTKSASGGSIVAPDFAAGDPPVSVRSAAKGDSIQPGQTRWYFVYYRDPNVLGGCPSGSTFNATQAGAIGWSF